MIHGDSDRSMRDADARKVHGSATLCSSDSQTDKYKSNGIVMDSPKRPSPTKQVSFSAVMNVSNLQVSFAERTATEMEEIVIWYEKYEGIERLKKKNKQSQSMPHNAMIVVDDDDDATIEGDNSFGNKIIKGVRSTDDEGDQQQNYEVRDEERVTIEDFSNGFQKIKTTKRISSNKNATTSLFSAVRSISRAQKCDEPPPPAIQISIDTEDESVASPMQIPILSDDRTKWTSESMVDAISEELLHESQKHLDVIPSIHGDKEAPSASESPESQVQALVEKTHDFNDYEEEVLAMLTPTSCSTKRMENDNLDCISTGQEAQSQIEATADLLRNTQNMADIISKLQESSSLLGVYDDDEDLLENVILDDSSVNEHSGPESTQLQMTGVKSTKVQPKLDEHGKVETQSTVTQSHSQLGAIGKNAACRLRALLSSTKD